MAKLILIDEFHLTVLVPADLSKSACASVVQVLRSDRFKRNLRSAVNDVVRRRAALRPVKLRLGR